MNLLQEIVFTIQNELHRVSTDSIDFDTTLNSYLRDKLHLTGTKRMCLEGGCGACIVAIRKRNAVTGKKELFAVNSCLVLLLSCHGWEIVTIESIKEGSGELHPIQETLVNHNGSQCGYCSPGMIMNMYALYENGELTEKDVENSFGGNICRCTGYRPIIEGFKTLCQGKKAQVDIEDIANCHVNNISSGSNGLLVKNRPIYYNRNNKLWIKVYTMNDLKQTLKTFKNYVLVSGNTAKGVYKSEEKDVFIDIYEVAALKTHALKGADLIIGGNVTLTDSIKLFTKFSKINGFAYLEEIARHIDLVANVPVRNMGTIAGNLMIKNAHPEFPSDLFVVFEGANAKLVIVDEDGKESSETLSSLLNLNMKGKIIRSVVFTKLSEGHVFRSYKIMPRAQNSHAIINAALLFNTDAKFNVLSANIVFGNISPNMVHAVDTEKFLINKSLLDNCNVQNSYQCLEEELTSYSKLSSSSGKVLKAISLFYKFVLSIVPKKFLSATHITGGSKLERPLSKSSQRYDTNQSLYPLTYPQRKIEVLAQVTGEAEYINDIPDMPNQLFAAFVLSAAPPNSHIQHIDTSQALKMPEVVAYFDKDDIPGKNNFMPEEANFSIAEEIFADDVIKYYHQPVGIIVSKSEKTAQKAAELVKISYRSTTDPVYVAVRDVVKANVQNKIIEYHWTTPRIPKEASLESQHTIKGSFDLSWQYHFHMENQCCTVIPKEDGLDVYPSSQWLDLSQTAIATSLNLPANMINISIRRLGGGFGAKISRNGLVACATSLAAYRLKKPVKMWVPLEINMNIMGRRCPLASDYEVSVDNTGVIQQLKNVFYSDYGVGGNEPSLPYIMDAFTSTYDSKTWEVQAYSAYTDTPANCWIRAPGTTEGSCMIESIMDHIAYVLGKDPLELRCLNLDPIKRLKLQEYITYLKKSADIEQRKRDIRKYNQENRWKKKGISVVPMTYNFRIFTNYGVIVSIYQADGSIAIAHGGVEIGQGINTKVAQVCAHKLGVAIEKIRVKPSNTLIAPNAGMTGGSLTSEGVCYGVIKACDILLKRMEPVKCQNPDDSWEQIVKKCFMEFINLSASSMSSPKEPELGDYTVYGVCSTEVDVDILTGQYYINRVDILEDAGVSMNPAVDIGQIEGGFVMGMGFHTSEQIILDDNGKLLTNRTWNYTPPTVKDIPVNFHVELLKNSSNPVGVLNSKATGEPPMCLSCSVPLAIRNAVAATRIENGHSPWYAICGPSTVQDTFRNCLNDYKNYTL